MIPATLEEYEKLENWYFCLYGPPDIDVINSVIQQAKDMTQLFRHIESCKIQHQSVQMFINFGVVYFINTYEFIERGHTHHLLQASYSHSQLLTCKEEFYLLLGLVEIF